MSVRTPFQLFNVSNFVGGVTFLQQRDNECEVMENFELQRDGYLTNRLGTYKGNSNSIGSAMIVGMDSVGVNFIVAKVGTTFYYYTSPNPPFPVAFSSFTVPTSPQNSPVRFSAMEDNATGDAIIYMVNRNFTGLLKWVPAAAASAYVASSPIGEYIHRYNKMLFVAGDPTKPNRLYFSDPGLPDSWPALNYIDISPRHGSITGLVGQPGQLVVFCERAVLSLRGTPPLRYDLDSIHERVGCDNPGSLSTFGSISYFMFQGALMELSSSVNLISDSLRNFAISDPTVNPNLCWGVLTPYYYLLTYPLNGNGTGGGAAPVVPAAANPVRVMVYDRVRFQAFYHWVYPPTTALGALAPVQALMSGPDSRSVAIAGGDGNVYVQPFRGLADYNYGTHTVPFTLDADAAAGTAVMGRWVSRRYDMGSSLIQKAHNRILVAGQGTANLTVHRYGVDNTLRTSVLYTAQSLPRDSRQPSFSGVTGFPRFSDIQFELSGANLIVTDVAVQWRALRLAGGGTLT